MSKVSCIIFIKREIDLNALTENVSYVREVASIGAPLGGVKLITRPNREAPIAVH